MSRGDRHRAPSPAIAPTSDQRTFRDRRRPPPTPTTDEATPSVVETGVPPRYDEPRLPRSTRFGYRKRPTTRVGRSVARRADDPPAAERCTDRQRRVAGELHPEQDGERLRVAEDDQERSDHAHRPLRGRPDPGSRARPAPTRRPVRQRPCPRPTGNSRDAADRTARGSRSAARRRPAYAAHAAARRRHAPRLRTQSRRRARTPERTRRHRPARRAASRARASRRRARRQPSSAQLRPAAVAARAGRASSHTPRSTTRRVRAGRRASRPQPKSNKTTRP